MDNETNNKLYCECCNYTATANAFWLKHLETQRHKRDGIKKPTFCDLCNYKSISHWNVNMHKIQKHSTKEERSKLKLYCSACDIVCMCQKYFDKHMESTRHKNQILVNKSLEEIKNKKNII
jgi:hypothetical protein